MKLTRIDFAEFRLDAEKLTLREIDFDARNGLKAEGIVYGEDYCAIAFGAPDAPGWPYDMPIFIRLPKHMRAHVERMAAAFNAIIAEADANAATVANLLAAAE